MPSTPISTPTAFAMTSLSPVKRRVRKPIASMAVGRQPMQTRWSSRNSSLTDPPAVSWLAGDRGNSQVIGWVRGDQGSELRITRTGSAAFDVARNDGQVQTRSTSNVHWFGIGIAGLDMNQLKLD